MELMTSDVQRGLKMKELRDLKDSERDQIAFFRPSIRTEPLQGGPGDLCYFFFFFVTLEPRVEWYTRL